MVMTDKPNVHDSPILIRGNPGRPGPIAPRRFLKAISTSERVVYKQGSGRLELAQAVASKDNPLTARVFVNRVWQHHFGQGLVVSPSDFGMRSDPPSHPELLDWLAASFMEDGWSVKKLHRRILLSDAYRQASVHPQESECAQRDSTNRLLWRFSRQRLEFEAMRDALLAVAGRLDRSLGGKSVNLTAEPFTARRTIYGFIDRQNLEGMYRVFDFADPNLSNPQRHRTTVPQQALFLLNSPFALEQARHAAESLTQEAPADRVRALYWRFFGRPATDSEIAIGVEFVQSCSSGESPTAAPSTTKSVPPWMRYAHALLMSNEFLFVD